MSSVDAAMLALAEEGLADEGLIRDAMELELQQQMRHSAAAASGTKHPRSSTDDEDQPAAKSARSLDSNDEEEEVKGDVDVDEEAEKQAIEEAIARAMDGPAYITICHGEWSAQLERSKWLFEQSVYLREAFQEPNKSQHSLPVIHNLTFEAFQSFMTVVRMEVTQQTPGLLNAIATVNVYALQMWITLAGAMTLGILEKFLVQQLVERSMELTGTECYEAGRRLCNQELLMEAALALCGIENLSSDMQLHLAPFWRQMCDVQITTSLTRRPTAAQWTALYEDWKTQARAIKTAGPSTEGELVLGWYVRHHRSRFSRWMENVGFKSVQEKLREYSTPDTLATSYHAFRPC